MGRKANPTLVGAFVVGAIALAVVGLLVFGSGKMFRRATKFVCFFTGAVDGLNIGAPVKFKGVEVGSVVDIRLRIEGQPEVGPQQIAKGIRIPVIIELDEAKLAGRGATALSDPTAFKRLIDLGLRAQLNAQSFVTGLLFIQLDFRSDTPADFVAPPGSPYLEIPTVPTALEQVRSAAEHLMRRLDQLDVEGIVRSASESLDGINHLVNAPQLKATIEALPETVGNVNQAVASVRDLATRLDTQVGPFLGSLKATTEHTNVAIDQLRVTLENVQKFIDPGSPLANQISSALQEMTGAARSVRLLADYIERNPSALVRGKDVKKQ
jgi:phospholipid/cholesterol/gamma-HCH transport system substrate-binding protein